MTNEKTMQGVGRMGIEKTSTDKHHGDNREEQLREWGLLRR